MNSNKKARTLDSGKAIFNIAVPYKLFETGDKDKKKPLILYLHGFKENIDLFRERCYMILEKVEAYHLFIQGPYPLYEHRNTNKKVEDWGSSWYLYDGSQDQFIKSLEQTSKFLDDILKKIKDKIYIDRLCLIGYSMGGYLAGYYAMTRSKSVNDLIVAAARIKTEVLKENWEVITHLNILALHGKNDNLVDYKPQRNEIIKLIKKGVKADFKLIDQKHNFKDEFLDLICDWLYENNYRHYEHNQID